jgi:hypothetical protein
MTDLPEPKDGADYYLDELRTYKDFLTDGLQRASTKIAMKL